MYARHGSVPPPRPGPRLAGHRGASALAVENTLRAVELAAEGGCDLVEVDVHLSRDGELVVIHDADLRRLAGRAERVGELTSAELAQVSLPGGERLARLVEVLALARGRLGVYVELKGPATGKALGALVRAGRLHGVELIGGSFEPALVAELRGAAPEIPRSVLFERGAVADMVASCHALGAAYAHPCFRPIDAAMVKALHDAQLRVVPPHTNDPAEARAFTEMGADVVMSDDPRVLSGLRA
ncbi:MAG: glycerophosphodiester phosphodiesterase [Candidatus Limnocylindria bacterium]